MGDVDQHATAILDSLDRAFGIPQSVQEEFGLWTSRGIVTHRAVPAVYQAWRIRETAAIARGRKILEIGAGMGRTAYYSFLLGLTDYAIVDLPTINIGQACFLGAVLGEDKIWLLGDSPDHKTGRIRIYPPSWSDDASERFAIVFNADSFTEMDRSFAFDYVRNAPTKSEVLLSINHECNAFTVSEAAAATNFDFVHLRFPYWMRDGYLEELFLPRQSG